MFIILLKYFRYLFQTFKIVDLFYSLVNNQFKIIFFTPPRVIILIGYKMFNFLEKCIPQPQIDFDVVFCTTSNSIYNTQIQLQSLFVPLSIVNTQKYTQISFLG